MAIYVDLTEFLASPHRTGIQRVGGELCRWWRAEEELIPVKLSASQKLVALPAHARQAVSDYFSAGPSQLDATRARILDMSNDAEREGREVGFSDAPVIVPEVFYDQRRVEYFRRLPTRYFANFYFIVFDILPLTHPQFFAADVPHEVIGGYFQVIRNAVHTGFISRTTREAYYSRLVRKQKEQGPVLRLGSNSLGERFDEDSRHQTGRRFTVLGTIEPRKQHAVVLNAFRRLVAEVPDSDLCFIGKMGWLDSATREQIENAAGSMHGCFEWIEHAGDALIRERLRSTRATIFISAAEGFGLPPVESLHLGIPVIASTGIPSLEDVRSGVRFVDGSSHELAEAMRELCDDSIFQMLTREAACLTLPTWESFTGQVADWVSHDK